jgi:hypothetical protein
VLQLIEAYLKAKVMDGLREIEPEVGTPQGAVITPPTMWQTVRSSLKGLFLVVGCGPATARDGSLDNALEGQGLRMESRFRGPSWKGSKSAKCAICAWSGTLRGHGWKGNCLRPPTNGLCP